MSVVDGGMFNTILLLIIFPILAYNFRSVQKVKEDLAYVKGELNRMNDKK